MYIKYTTFLFSLVTMIESILSVIQLIVAVAMMCTILLQQKGSGLGAAFGGAGGAAYSTRRGVDKILYQTTIVLAVIFFLVALVTIII